MFEVNLRRSFDFLLCFCPSQPSQLSRATKLEMIVFQALYAGLCFAGAIRPQFQLGERYSWQARPRVFWLTAWLSAASIFQVKAPQIQAAIIAYREVMKTENWLPSMGIGSILTGFLISFVSLNPMSVLLGGFLGGAAVGPYFKHVEERQIWVILKVAIEARAWCYIPFAFGDGMLVVICDLVEFFCTAGTRFTAWIIRILATPVARNFPRAEQMARYIDDNAPSVIERGRHWLQGKTWTAMCHCCSTFRQLENVLTILGIRPHEWANLYLSVRVSMDIQLQKACFTETWGMANWKYLQWTRDYCNPWSFEDWQMSCHCSLSFTLLRIVCEEIFCYDSPEAQAKREAAGRVVSYLPQQVKDIGGLIACSVPKKVKNCLALLVASALVLTCVEPVFYNSLLPLRQSWLRLKTLSKTDILHGLQCCN